jgi:RsiW-degrading membrane proteinase PrsW (M82 family)
MIEFMVIFALAFGPAVYWLWYFYNKDKYEPEPLSKIVWLYFLGMVVVIPAALIEALFEYITQSNGFVTTVVYAPIVEEILKFLVVYLFIYRDIEFNEPVDGIIYAAAAALGFASLENLLYVFNAYHGASIVENEAPIVSASLVASTRAILSVPGHVLFATFWGNALGLAKFMLDKKAAKTTIIMGICLGIIFHGLFNYFTNSPLGTILIIGLMIFLWGNFHGLLEKLLLQSPFRTEDES